MTVVKPDNGHARPVTASPSAIWREGDFWCAGIAPFKTISAESGVELNSFTQRVATARAEAPGCIVAGLLSYDAGKHLANLPVALDRGEPLAVAHLYKASDIVRDTSLHALLAQRLAGLPAQHSLSFTSDVDKAHYLGSLDQIRDYLRAGDCYQVNYARRFSSGYTGVPLVDWARLAMQHAAPHASYFSIDARRAVFGVSPERFLRIQDRHVTTEPIKGSRPRGHTDAEDEELASILRSSEKDRAENLMIVDLLRNDLGKVCTAGSIKAEKLFELRRFSNVQHLVSIVTGALRDEVDALDALLQCFPGGSITGAPKKRAMEIIAELEPHPRGFYCGSQFVLDSEGNLDSNILIRTFQTNDDKIYCHGGGGIVIDSDPEQEFAESEFKIRALMNTLL